MPTNLSAPTIAAVMLNFSERALDEIEVHSGSGGEPVRSSPVLAARHAHFRWAGGTAALVLFFLNQVLWVATDRRRADRELHEAVLTGRAVPSSAPVWEEGTGPFVATLAEALKQKWKPARAPEKIFGQELLVAADDAIRYRQRRPQVWLDVRVLSPLKIEVRVDGALVTDPARIAALMRSVAASRRWSAERLIPTQ